jgi:hypothetical protein
MIYDALRGGNWVLGRYEPQGGEEEKKTRKRVEKMEKRGRRS